MKGQNMDIVALLPMKGHSERVPNKNLRICAGKPLFLWVLETLLASNQVSKIIVNTDSKEIASVAKFSSNILVHMRPTTLRGDMVSMNEIIKYDLSQEKGEHFLQTHATNPLLTTATLDQAISKYHYSLSEHDSLFSVTNMQTRLYDYQYKPINHDPAKLIRTQDLDPIYEENSNFFIFSRSSFQKHHRRIGETPILYPMNKYEALDIDTEEDFTVAEAILQSKVK